MSKVKRLGDIVNFKRGYDLPAYQRKQGKYPVVSSGGISGYHSEYKADGEGIVTGRYGTLGEMHYVNGKYWPHNTALYVTDFKGNHPKYVYYLLKCLGNLKTSDKSTVPGINRNDLHELFVPYVKEGQVAIATILSSLDQKIEVNNRINAELEAMAKTLYDYWFVQFDFPDENGKPYKSSGGKMVYSEELKREIPAGWENSKLAEIVTIHDSKRIPLSKKQRENKKGKYPYYGATEVMDYIDDYIFDGNYILIAEDGSVMDLNGFPNLQYITGKCWINNHAHVLEANEKTGNEYLFLMLQKMPVVKIMSGSIQKKITQENLKNAKILKADDKTLKKFKTIISPLFRNQYALEKENQQLAELRDWLLPMLMNGQVQVESIPDPLCDDIP